MRLMSAPKPVVARAYPTDTLNMSNSGGPKSVRLSYWQSVMPLPKPSPIRRGDVRSWHFSTDHHVRFHGGYRR